MSGPRVDNASEVVTDCSNDACGSTLQAPQAQVAKRNRSGGSDDEGRPDVLKGVAFIVSTNFYDEHMVCFLRYSAGGRVSSSQSGQWRMPWATSRGVTGSREMRPIRWQATVSSRVRHVRPAHTPCQQHLRKADLIHGSHPLAASSFRDCGTFFSWRLAPSRAGVLAAWRVRLHGESGDSQGSGCTSSRARPIFRSRNIRNVPEYLESGISVIPGIFRNTDHGWGLQIVM